MITLTWWFLSGATIMNILIASAIYKEDYDTIGYEIGCGLFFFYFGSMDRYYRYDI